MFRRFMEERLRKGPMLKKLRKQMFKLNCLISKDSRCKSFGALRSPDFNTNNLVLRWIKDIFKVCIKTTW
jgi:hypothetical protein